MADSPTRAPSSSDFADLDRPGGTVTTMTRWLLAIALTTMTPAVALAADLAVPHPHPDYPDIAFHLGDPVEVLENGKWYPGIITDLKFDDRPFTVNMELYAQDRWWPTKEVRTVAGFPYAKLPATSSVGTEGAWKEGDQVEVEYIWNYEMYWGPGVVVSVDGDNYDVYMPEGTGTTNEHYVWRHSDRIRNPGNKEKTGWAMQPDPNGVRAGYEAAAAAAGCAVSEQLPYLWYYDHSFDRPVYGVTLYAQVPDTIKTALAAYKCMAPIASKHPNVPSDGVQYKGAIPLSVQAGFLAQADKIMKDAMLSDARHALLAIVVRETTYETGGPVPVGLPRVDGVEYSKKVVMSKEENKKMGELLALVGETLPYPWDVLEQRYATALATLQAYADTQTGDLTTIRGLNSEFTLTDAKVEGLAKAANLKHHPGSTVLASKVDSATLTVIKDAMDRPEYRYKYAALLVKDPALLMCNKVVWRYREDYANGAYGAGYVDRFGGYELSSVDDYCKCP
jgi:hypothetical protein